MDKMIRYDEADEQELAEAARTFIKKCTDYKSNHIGMTVQVGDLFLDIDFSFKINKASSDRFKGINSGITS